jgi:hypothetical protein
MHADIGPAARNGRGEGGLRELGPRHGTQCARGGQQAEQEAGGGSDAAPVPRHRPLIGRRESSRSRVMAIRVPPPTTPLRSCRAWRVCNWHVRSLDPTMLPSVYVGGDDRAQAVLAGLGQEGCDGTHRVRDGLQCLSGTDQGTAPG